jgi:DNA polymerase-3 subunit chi
MPKVNFYLLKQNTDAARAALACKLAEQQMRLGQRVYLQAASDDDARELDQLLWSFTPESFVPHALAVDAAASAANVVVGAGAIPPATTCVLNLAAGPVAVTDDHLGAIAEFILNDDEAKAKSRTRWNHYKQLGYELQLHQL